MVGIRTSWRLAGAWAALLAIAIGLFALAGVPQHAYAADAAAPAVPKVTVASKGSTTMKLTLSDANAVTGFQVHYREASGTWKLKTVKAKTAVLTGMKVNHTYAIQARAWVASGGKNHFSAYSKAQSVFNGVEPLKSSEIKKRYHKSFVHGKKPKSHQRYIMLHDTEISLGATGTVRSWTNSNGGTVAAHFVIGRDGTVVQTAPMDKILHHAGYGGPGNYDKKFKVGKNNGKGSGDNLKGRVKWAGYTSYGMNSYSIGIELCHHGKQKYTKKQLKALDRVIATIDKHYGGYGGKIIDHKEWRPSNSDTSKKFAKYLKNYKKYRKHTK